MTRFCFFWFTFFLLVCFKSFGQQPRLMLPIGHIADITKVQFSLDSKRVLTSSNDGTSNLWDASSGQILLGFKGHGARFSMDCKKIVTALSDSTARIWDAETGELLLTLKGHTDDRFFTVQFSPDSKKIVTASSDKTVKIWDAETGKILIDLEGLNSSAENAEFSPDGKKIIAGLSDSTAKIWDCCPELNLAMD